MSQNYLKQLWNLSNIIFWNRESCSSEESPTQAQQRPVSDFDSETGRVRRATALYQQQRTISAPVGSFPALSLLEETVIDDPLYDMVPHEDPGL